jgi:hypothetical protein
MEICFFRNGEWHCHYIPVYYIPWVGVVPPPNGNYYHLLHDASIIASLQQAANQLSDEGARSALNSGIESALSALKARAGTDVQIREIGTREQ